MKTSSKISFTTSIVLAIWLYGFTCNFSAHLAAEFFNPINVFAIMINNLMYQAVYAVFGEINMIGKIIQMMIGDLISVLDILWFAFVGAHFISIIWTGEGFKWEYVKSRSIINIYTGALILFLTLHQFLYAIGFSYRFRSTEIIGISEIVALVSLGLAYIIIQKAKQKSQNPLGKIILA